MRFVYQLQEPSTSDESDEPDSDSDDSSSSKRLNRSSRRIRSGKQRMSIMSNQLLSIPRVDENGYDDFGCGWHPSELNGQSKSSTARRRFFQSAAHWDDRMQRVLVSTEGLAMPQISVAEMMEMGGRNGENDGSEPEEEMEVDEEEGES